MRRPWGDHLQLLRASTTKLQLHQWSMKNEKILTFVVVLVSSLDWLILCVCVIVYRFKVCSHLGKGGKYLIQWNRERKMLPFNNRRERERKFVFYSWQRCIDSQHFLNSSPQRHITAFFGGVPGAAHSKKLNENWCLLQLMHVCLYIYGQMLKLARMKVERWTHV